MGEIQPNKVNVGKIWGRWGKCGERFLSLLKQLNTYIMATISYIIKASSNADLAKVYARLKDGRFIDQTSSTGIAVPPLFWDKKRETVIIKGRNNLNNNALIDEMQAITDRLSDLKEYITRQYAAKAGENIDKGWLKDTISAFLNSIDPSRNKMLNLNNYIVQYIAEMKAGERKNSKGLLYSPGTIKNKVSFYSELCKFQEETGKKYDFNDITIDFYNAFVDFFNKKNYSPNTTGKHIKSLKEMMTAAREEGLHQNFQTTLKAFKILSCEADTIYLTREEITAIERLNLSASKHKDLDLCRDIFLVGVYVTQRYSDYHRINKTNLITLENGKKAVKLTQQKTKAKVVIPCSQELLAILAKYDYNLPPTYSQFINENIKIVCRMAGIKQKVEHVQTKGAKVVTEQIEKFRLVTTHTARRTGATLMYLEGVDTLSIMKITGHKTEKEFKKYIRVGEEENALILSNNRFYNRLTIAK